jgi:hypothetical protein
MARTYGRIKAEVWRDEEFRALTIHAQWAFFMLLSQPDLSLCGAIAYRPGRWSRYAPNLGAERMAALIETLAEKRYVLVDLDTEELLIRTFVKHECNLKNPKVKAGVLSAINQIESPALRQSIADGSPIDHQSITDPQDSDRSPIDQLPILSNQEAMSNEQGASSREQCPAVAPLGAAAAAAMELYVAYRMSKTDADCPEIYAKEIHRKEMTLQRAVLNQLEVEGRTPREIVEQVWHLTPTQIARIPRRTR